MDPVYVEHSSIGRRRQRNELLMASQLGGAQVIARLATELHRLPFAGNDVLVGFSVSAVFLLTTLTPATI